MIKTILKELNNLLSGDFGGYLILSSPIWIPLLITMLVTGCVDKKEANKTLTNAGFSNIKTYNYSWFACSEDDFYHTKFTAINPIGKEVSGVVCSGLLFKNSTIRF